MKKLSHVLFVALLLAVVSCQKENIAPNGDTVNNRPTWQIDGTTDNNRGDGFQDENSQDKGVIVVTGEGAENGSQANGGTASEGKGNGGITDPNKDPDANKQKGGRGRR